jgi:succinate dehydrogenase/fumarate reductase flavoprotein subunit
MTKTYVVEMMTNANYERYMRDDFSFGNVEKVEIVADTKEEAIAKAEAQYKGYIINKNYVKTVEELAEIKSQQELKVAEAKRKEEEIKLRKANAELEKANEMGLTLEQYKEYKKEQANKKRYATEIRKAKAEIEELQKRIAYYENKLK